MFLKLKSINTMFLELYHTCNISHSIEINHLHLDRYLAFLDLSSKEILSEEAALFCGKELPVNPEKPLSLKDDTPLLGKAPPLNPEKPLPPNPPKPGNPGL